MRTLDTLGMSLQALAVLPLKLLELDEKFGLLMIAMSASCASFCRFCFTRFPTRSKSSSKLKGLVR